MYKDNEIVLMVESAAIVTDSWGQSFSLDIKVDLGPIPSSFQRPWDLYTDGEQFLGEAGDGRAGGQLFGYSNSCWRTSEANVHNYNWGNIIIIIIIIINYILYNYIILIYI